MPQRLLDAFKNHLKQANIGAGMPGLPGVQPMSGMPTPTMTERMRKLDQKGIGIDALEALKGQDFRTVMEKAPLLQAIAQKNEAEKADRRRRMIEELRYPGLHRTPEEKVVEEGGNPSAMGPAAPGTPEAPSNLLGLNGPSQPAPSLAQALQGISGMPKMQSFVEYVVKSANGDESEEHEEGEIESPEHEAEESLPPEILQQLVNYITQMGQGIDDEGFHQQAESLGVDEHEAEEEIYRLLAKLVGGKDDVIPGGLAAGMPTSMFPKAQIEKGTEVELEHTSNPAVAQEIAKDHLTEGDDYYEPRLDDLEKGMEDAVDEGKIEAVGEGTKKHTENKERKDRDVEKLKKNAFKYGFYEKFAEAGIRPSELDGALEKAAQTSALAEIIRQGGGLAKNLAILTFLIPTAGIPLLGAGASTAAYSLSREPTLDPEELRHVERMALYKRLTRQAERRAKKNQPQEREAEGETQPDDAHNKILPMTAGGVEI